MDSMVRTINIGGREIGPGNPCFIIAEAGVNHNGDLKLARELVEAAVNIGADAIKFQTFKAELVVTSDAPKAEYQMRTTDSTESQLEMIRRLELSPENHRELVDFCNQKEITFLSSPFDEPSVDLLDELSVPAFKIPSGEITNFPLVTRAAQKGKPLIVSTGMSYLSEVEAVVRAIEATGNNDYVLLHCVSNYPAGPADVNLAAMATMASAFGAPVGYSDHTLGKEVPLAAVAMGACLIEKHLTLDNSLPGPDHKASLEPGEFADLIRGIRIVESALGNGRKEPAESEAGTADMARKSLVAMRDIKKGEALTPELLVIKRPGTGIPTAMISYLIGRTVKADIPAGSLISLEMLA
jgi:N,N'-diacetyllegionaminate synthase